MKKIHRNPCDRLFVRICGRKHVYQLFLRDESLLLYRIGSVSSGIDHAAIQPMDVSLQPPGKQDILLREADVVRIRHVQKDGEKIIRIRMLHRFLELQPFRTDYRLICNVMDTFAKHAQPGAASVHGIIRKETHTSKAYLLLRCANVLLCILSLLLFFFPKHMLLNISLLPLLLILYCCFPGELTLIESTKRTGRRYDFNPPVDVSHKVCRGRISIILPLALSSAAACRGIYNIHNEARQLLFAILAAACLLAIALVFSFDWRDQKSTIAVLILFFLLYSFGTIGVLNQALDRKPFASENAAIIEKYSSGSRTKNRKIRVSGEGGNAIYRLSHSQYQAVNPGDEVVIHHRKGWLDIPYSQIQLP